MTSLVSRSREQMCESQCDRDAYTQFLRTMIFFSYQEINANCAQTVITLSTGDHPEKDIRVNNYVVCNPGCFNANDI